ncbi:hypothetical protein ACN47E_005200 [Coniothyrium glycines]
MAGRRVTSAMGTSRMSMGDPLHSPSPAPGSQRPTGFDRWFSRKRNLTNDHLVSDLNAQIVPGPISQEDGSILLSMKRRNDEHIAMFQSWFEKREECAQKRLDIEDMEERVREMKRDLERSEKDALVLKDECSQFYMDDVARHPMNIEVTQVPLAFVSRRQVDVQDHNSQSTGPTDSSYSSSPANLDHSSPATLYDQDTPAGPQTHRRVQQKPRTGANTPSKAPMSRDKDETAMSFDTKQAEVVQVRGLPYEDTKAKTPPVKDPNGTSYRKTLGTRQSLDVPPASGKRASISIQGRAPRTGTATMLTPQPSGKKSVSKGSGSDALPPMRFG